MGSTTSALIRQPHQTTHVSSDSPNNSTAFALNLSSRDPHLQGGGGSTASFLQAAANANSGVLLQEMMNSLSNSASGFDQDAFVSGVLSNSKKDGNFTANDGGGSGGGEGLTRDFLGLRAFSHTDILSMAGFGNVVNTSSSSSHDQQQQQNPSVKTWRN